ncbi:MAG: helix-turn-helix domain-containing protein [Ferrovibrionaceae bacterium]
MTDEKREQVQDDSRTVKLDANNAVDLTVPDDNRQAFAHRLRLVMGKEGPYIWGPRIGTSPQAIQKWLSCKTEPGMQSLIALSEATGVTIDWIATGRGPRDGGAPSIDRVPGKVVIDRLTLGDALEAAEAVLIRANELAAERGERQVKIDLRSLAQVAGGIYEDLHWAKQSSLSQDLNAVDAPERRGKVGNK